MGFRQYLLCGTPAVLDSILVFPSLAEPWWMLVFPAGTLLSLPPLAHGVGTSLQAVSPEGGLPWPCLAHCSGVPRGGQVPHRDLQGCHPLPPNPAKEARQLTEPGARHGAPYGFLQLMEAVKF